MKYMLILKKRILHRGLENLRTPLHVYDMQPHVRFFSPKISYTEFRVRQHLWWNNTRIIYFPFDTVWMFHLVSFSPKRMGHEVVQTASSSIANALSPESKTLYITFVFYLINRRHDVERTNSSATCILLRAPIISGFLRRSYTCWPLSTALH
jgi:hypothetical protein